MALGDDEAQRLFNSRRVQIIKLTSKAEYRLGSCYKIKETCRIARSNGLATAWIDTCCIDKTSSAELSEAINSMFRWYRESNVCYVYLSDFEPITDQVAEMERCALIANRFPRCRWFTRGWTLQELIAPTQMVFFDCEWNTIGNKESLKEFLFDITKIDEDILSDSSGLNSIPIARKMSWAVDRQTTRVEDRAYSLLGIFDINLPLLYGEGTKAFLRLQRQIASESNDLSLFAWQQDAWAGAGSPQFSSILAHSPDDFDFAPP